MSNLTIDDISEFDIPVPTAPHPDRNADPKPARKRRRRRQQPSTDGDGKLSAGLIDMAIAPMDAPSGNGDGKAKPKRQKKEKTGSVVKRLADSICDRQHFAQDGGGKLYRYNGGAFRPRAEEYVEQQVKKNSMLRSGVTSGAAALPTRLWSSSGSIRPPCPTGRGWTW